jgi:hypothetical protein
MQSVVTTDTVQLTTDLANPIPMLYVEDGPRCPWAPCDRCNHPCGIGEPVEDGTYQLPFTVRSDYRLFAAILNGRLVAGLGVKAGIDARPGLARLETELVGAARQPTLLR